MVKDLFPTPIDGSQPEQPTDVPPNFYSMLVPRYHKMNFPSYDGEDDLLQWLNRCEHLFTRQWTPDHEKVWYASFHLTGATQLWYMRLSQESPITDWSEIGANSAPPPDATC